MGSYSLILSKQRSSVFYPLIGLVGIVCNAVILSIVRLGSQSEGDRYLCFFGLLVCILTVVFWLLNRFRIFTNSFSPAASFVILGILLFILGNYYFGLCDIGLAVASLLSKRADKVIFNDQGIEIPSFIKKNHAWSEFNNVILKDNVLTLDFRNNKLMQPLIDPEANGALREEEFNDFCRERLSARINTP